MISIDRDTSGETAELKHAFECFIRDAYFPCVGAKSALARGMLKTVVCRSITSAWDDLPMHEELMGWAASYRADPGLFRSLAFVFSKDLSLDEEQFEHAMWSRLQSLADKDAWLAQSYDHRVSADPEDPHFSLSFGGEAYFVVGLHPNASRPARRFLAPRWSSTCTTNSRCSERTGAMRASVIKSWTATYSSQALPIRCWRAMETLARLRNIAVGLSKKRGNVHSTIHAR